MLSECPVQRRKLKLERLWWGDDTHHIVVFGEETLNVDSYNRTVHQCVRIGGVSERSMISSLMTRFMTKILMCQFNMLGQRGKLAFKNTKLCNVIADSVMKKFKEASERDVLLQIACKLRNAPKLRPEPDS